MTTEATESPSYKSALEELETILNAIENDHVDIDELAQNVERAAELLNVCRDKIERTEMQVRRIIDTLEPQDIT